MRANSRLRAATCSCLAWCSGRVVQTGHPGHPAGRRVDHVVEGLRPGSRTRAGPHRGRRRRRPARSAFPATRWSTSSWASKTRLGAVGDRHLADLLEVEVGPDDLVPVLVGAAVDDQPGGFDAPERVGDGQVAQGDAKVLAHGLDQDDRARSAGRTLTRQNALGRLAERSEVASTRARRSYINRAGAIPMQHARPGLRPRARVHARPPGSSRPHAAGPARPVVEQSWPARRLPPVGSARSSPSRPSPATAPAATTRS